jgi:hypothetical protein
MKKFKFEEWLDKKGDNFEVLCIFLFWVFIFDPIIYLITKDMDWVIASQTPFIIFILAPYVLFRTRKIWKKKD